MVTVYDVFFVQDFFSNMIFNSHTKTINYGDKIVKDIFYKIILLFMYEIKNILKLSPRWFRIAKVPPGAPVFSILGTGNDKTVNPIDR